MYNSDTELMFPLRVVPHLRGQRGDQWQELVDRVTAPDVGIAEQSAFTLLMVRLGGCQGCGVDSFRGMRGCTACAKQTIRRYRGSDTDLQDQFEQAKTDIEQYLSKD